MSRLMAKPTKWDVRPAKTRINLGILPDWVGAQADLSLRWAHMQFCQFCREVAQIVPLSYQNCQFVQTLGNGHDTLMFAVQLFKDMKEINQQTLNNIKMRVSLATLQSRFHYMSRR